MAAPENFPFTLSLPDPQICLISIWSCQSCLPQLHFRIVCSFQLLYRCSCLWSTGRFADHKPFTWSTAYRASSMLPCILKALRPSFVHFLLKKKTFRMRDVFVWSVKETYSFTASKIFFGMITVFQLCLWFLDMGLDFSQLHSSQHADFLYLALQPSAAVHQKSHWKGT